MTTAAKSSKGPDHDTHTDSSAGSNGVALAPPAYGIDMVDRTPIGEGPLQLMPKVDQMRGPGLLGAKGRAISASAPSPPPNNNGLPDHLKAGIESRSRFDMSVVQRKHASSGAGLTGECADRQEDKWRGTNGARVQMKLSIGASNDPLEQEADRVAEQVMRMAEPTVQRTCATCAGGGLTCPTCKKNEDDHGLVQRKTATLATSFTHSVPDNFLQGLGPGQPLDSATRAFFEPRFKQDLSQVRIHTDEKAGESARAVNALAYTVGHHVVFDASLYAPQTEAGKRLLAHELTHTVQQRMADATAPPRLTLTAPKIQLPQDSEATAEADEIGTSMTRISVQPIQVARDERDAGVEDPYRIQQLECVRRQGGCLETRPAGIPSEAELKDYNYVCRGETGYAGQDIIPTSAECNPVSIELPGAPGGSTPEIRVAGWLSNHRSTIVSAETSYSVDRRAVAGAIAWEALENPRSWFGAGLARFRGPGKVHYKKGYIFEGDPVAKQIEQQGYLPRASKEEREGLLSTVKGSIAYIAAIMKAFADIAATAGYYLNCVAPMLATFFNAWDLKKARVLFKRKKAPAKLVPNDQMGQWVEKNETYLENAVGKPAGALCNLPRGYGEGGHRGHTSGGNELPSRRLGDLLNSIMAQTATSLELREQLDALGPVPSEQRTSLEHTLNESRAWLLVLLDERVALLHDEIASLHEKIGPEMASSSDAPERTGLGVELFQREQELLQHEQQLKPLRRWQTRQNILSIEAEIVDIDSQLASLPPVSDPAAPLADRLAIRRCELEERKKQLAATLTTTATEFEQWDPRWGAIRYGPSPNCTNIKQQGCGPTSLAIVLNYLYQEDPESLAASGAIEIVSPPDAARYAATNGRVCNSGTAGDTMVTNVHTGWPGFYGRKIALDLATEELRRGNLVIFLCKSCSGKTRGGGTKSYGGHFMVLNGVSVDGTVFNVLDPGARESKDIDTILLTELRVHARGFWTVDRI